jgi:C4-dicarboxylate transporter DctM subunit
MALGKYAVDYEKRVDYDRLRKERLQRAKDQINKDGLGAIVTWDEANIRYMTSYYVTTPLRLLEAQFVFCPGNGEPHLIGGGTPIEVERRMPWMKDRVHPPVGLAVLVILLFAGMWIGAAMAMVGFLGYAYILGINPAFGMISQIPFTTMAWYPLTCVPLFIFMGVVIFQSEVGKDLYKTAYTLVGQFKGGLAMATVIACALFAAITGVSSPALATLGKVAVPEMKKYSYDEKLALGSLACAGTTAFLIPPSVAFIIYGILTETSIARLFMAGFFPGVLLTGLFIITIMIITAIRPTAGPAGPKTSLKQKIVAMKYTWPMVLLFLLVLGGIYGGVFTPTEAGAIGAFGAIVISIIMRRLTFKKFLDAILEAGKTTAFIMLLIIGAYILMKFLAVSELTILLGRTVAQLPVPPMVIFAAIMLLYIILGMFLDIMSAVILTIPVLFPVVIFLGFDPIWYGVILVILIEMGLVTPPVGMDAFVLSGVTGMPLSSIFQGVAPFLLAAIVCIILLTIFPQIALFLPSTM